jgi:hypothetical protein
MEEVSLGLLYSAFFFIFFIFSCFSIGKITTTSLYSTLPFLSEYKIVIGFFFHVILFSLISLMLPINFTIQSNLLLIFLCVSTGIGAIQLLKEKVFRFRIDFSLIFIFILYILLGLALTRFHASPDNHGLSATVSYLRENINFHFLQRDFMNVTQSEIPAHLGQKTDILESTWNIADSRLRFTSDNILTVGRIGMPLLISSLIIPANLLYGFSYFLIFFGIFGAWILIKILQDVYEELRNQFYFKERKNTYQKKLIRILLVISPLLSVWILEGTVNQLMLLLSVSWQLLLHLKISQVKILSPLIIIFLQSLGLLFIVFVYPHGLPYALLVFLLGNIYEMNQFTREVVLRRVYIVLSGIGIIALPLFLLLRFTFIPLVKSFLSGVSGAPYNLGAIDLFDALFWFGSSITFTEASAPGSGFGLVTSDYAKVTFQAVILTIALIYFMARSRLVLHRKVVLSFLLLAALIPIPYFTFSSDNPNSYIFVKYFALYLIITLPFVSIINLTFRPLFSRFCTYIIFALIIIQVALFSQAGQKFSDTSQLFAAWDKNLDKSIFTSNSVFVSEVPSHAVFSLANFGPLLYLTDNWNPRLNPQAIPTIYRIYVIALVDGKFEVDFVGNLNLKETLDGPITYAEIKQYISTNEK